MCERCDQPDLTMEAHLEQVRDRLRRERFVVQSVSGSAREAEYSYSIGLAAQGLPELVVVGVRPAEAVPLVGTWGEYLLDESLVLPGETLECGPFLMEAVEVEHPAQHLQLAIALRGGPVRAAAGVGGLAGQVALGAGAPGSARGAAAAGGACAAVLPRAPAGPARRPAAPVTRQPSTFSAPTRSRTLRRC